MRRFFLIFILAGMCLLAGCNLGPTEEELAASRLEEETAAVLAEEEASGIRRLNSPNLEGPERTLLDFVQGLRGKDPERVADALGTPNLFSQEALVSWVTAYDFEQIAAAPLEDIQIKVSKSGAEASLNVTIGEKGNDLDYKAKFEKDRWILIPPEGVSDGYSFLAPTKNIYFEDLYLAEFAVATDNYGYEWTFTIPHMPMLPESPSFLIETNLGRFEGVIHEVSDRERILLAELSEETKAEFLKAVVKSGNTVFEELKQGATQEQIASLVHHKEIVAGCFPAREDAAAAYQALLATVEGFDALEDDIVNGYPQEYTIRLAGENGVILHTKLRISTENGECRRKATFIMQNYDGWKIVYVENEQTRENPFVDISTYNPAW